MELLLSTRLPLSSYDYQTSTNSLSRRIIILLKYQDFLILRRFITLSAESLLYLLLSTELIMPALLFWPSRLLILSAGLLLFPLFSISVLLRTFIIIDLLDFSLLMLITIDKYSSVTSILYSGEDLTIMSSELFIEPSIFYCLLGLSLNENLFIFNASILLLASSAVVSIGYSEE